VTPLASLATFGTYVAVHGGAALTPSLAFTILALFSILVRLFAIAPLGTVLRPYYQVIGQGHNPSFLVYYSTVLVCASSCCVC
jgi:hypothetical protein